MPQQNIGSKITIARKSGAAAAIKRLLNITKLAAYVGIPASSSVERSEQLLKMAGSIKNPNSKRARKLRKAAKTDINNAELLFIHTKGSPIKNIPPRPVIEPAIAAPDNAAIISREIGSSIKASLADDHPAAVLGMQRAALAGQNAARKWFTDPRNAWAPNKPATIKRKGSDKPLIDTGAMRAAIQGIVGEE